MAHFTHDIYSALVKPSRGHQYSQLTKELYAAIYCQGSGSGALGVLRGMVSPPTACRFLAAQSLVCCLRRRGPLWTSMCTQLG
jgi:hypothetical protein